MHIRWEIDYIVSTHSRPKAAAMEIPLTARVDDVSTHSRPKAAAKEQIKQKIAEMFQHTAARRRLLNAVPSLVKKCGVSTHSRPKAAAVLKWYSKRDFGLFQHTAARRRLLAYGFITPDDLASFNTQPPEGGCTRCGLLANET